MGFLEDFKPELPNIPKFPRIDIRFIPYIMILAYTIGFSYYTIMKYYTYHTSAYDLGIFLNSFYNTIYEGKFLYTTLWEGSRFQNHFSPILFLLLPIYKVFPRVETLLIIQSFILAIGALPIYWIAKNEINKKAGVIFSLLYLSYPALQGINRFDFHEVAFAPAFILFTFYFYRQKRYLICSIFVFLSLISREDVAMVVVPMALIWLWDIRTKWSIKDKETLFCTLTILIGSIWFVITTAIFIPMFNSEGYWFVKEYNINFLLFSLSKKEGFLINIFLPLLFTSLLNKWILVGVPILGRNLLSNRATRFEINNQHQALLAPFIFISSIYFIKAVSEFIKKDDQLRLLSKKLAGFLILILLAINFYISPIPMEIKKYSIIRPVDMPDVTPMPIPYTGILPITPHDNALTTIINEIPINASVYAQSNLFTHIANRPRVYSVDGEFQIFKGWSNPQIGLVVPWKNVGYFDYILVDNSNFQKSMLRKTDIDTLNNIKQNYGIYIAIDGIYLFKKGFNVNGTFNGTNNDPLLLNNFNNHFLEDYYNGVVVDYYDNGNLYGNPIVSERRSNINFNWNTESPIPGIINFDNFSAKFDGYIYIPVTGNYIFSLFADDKVRLYLDNQLVVDTWQSASPVENFYKTNLGLGLHKIRLDYVEKVNQAYIYLYWNTPWNLNEIIPNEFFYIPKKNVDNIYNGGEIINPVTIVNNNSNNNSNNLTKMRNDNTATINYSEIIVNNSR